MKFDGPRDASGTRRVRYVSFRGSRRQAQRALAGFIASVDENRYVEPHKVTVAAFVRDRIDAWAAAGAISAASAQRYRHFVRDQIAPTPLGAVPLQRLKPLDIEAWHVVLATTGRRDGKGGLNARTIGCVHRLLGKALREAVNNDLVARNVADLRPPPRVDPGEPVIIRQDRVASLLAALAGHPLHAIVVVALFTGLRRSEILALKWQSIDLDGGRLQVTESLEELEDGTLTFKSPKTRAGRRIVTLPAIVIETLREHRKGQAVTRLALGLGRQLPDALIFPALDGSPRSPHAFSKRWSELADRLGFGAVTFHSLRHSHASMLIDQGVDAVTISKRLGHASPAVTMAVYAHLFQNSDAKAAAAIDRALGGGQPA